MLLRSQTSSIYSLHAKQISPFSFEMHLILGASEQTIEGERCRAGNGEEIQSQEKCAVTANYPCLSK
jgi:hypothetical protein